MGRAVAMRNQALTKRIGETAAAESPCDYPAYRAALGVRRFCGGRLAKIGLRVEELRKPVVAARPTLWRRRPETQERLEQPQDHHMGQPHTACGWMTGKARQQWRPDNVPVVSRTAWNSKIVPRFAGLQVLREDFLLTGKNRDRPDGEAGALLHCLRGDLQCERGLPAGIQRREDEGGDGEP